MHKLLLLLFLFSFTANGQYVAVSGKNIQNTKGTNLTIKGVNTDPYQHNWTTWWSLSNANFKSDLVLRLAAWDSLNINVVRTMIDTGGVQHANFTANFATLIDTLKDRGLYLMAELFVWAKPPGQHASDTTTVERCQALYNTFVNAYDTDTTIFSWGIRQESYNALYSLRFPQAECDSMILWHKRLYDWVRGIDANHLIVHSCDPYNQFKTFEASIGTYTMSQLNDYSAIEFYKDPMDWDGTNYGDQTTYNGESFVETGFLDYLEFMRTSKGRGMAGKPIIVTEIGERNGQNPTYTEQIQLEFYNVMGKIFNSNEINGIVIWTDKNSYNTGSNYMYGLADSLGNLLPSGHWYRNWTLGSEIYDIWK